MIGWSGSPLLSRSLWCSLLANERESSRAGWRQEGEMLAKNLSFCLSHSLRITGVISENHSVCSRSGIESFPSSYHSEEKETEGREGQREGGLHLLTPLSFSVSISWRKRVKGRRKEGRDRRR